MITSPNKMVGIAICEKIKCPGFSTCKNDEELVCWDEDEPYYETFTE